jgi:hypothetical protein
MVVTKALSTRNARRGAARRAAAMGGHFSSCRVVAISDQTKRCQEDCAVYANMVRKIAENEEAGIR